ncbi:hypothetical protein [Rhodobacter sp. 24-YEA-8]|uniref:hypothetical protein n=1 Tax=Rhodobacter sp. 24-YEA-8 TaxID=1884310 RepID=UPI000894668F|nr:hypothetical protein [Rhodobacter sp. 24-YEA-8]SED17862.1 hypothetical protein SAMN05519105_3540 [Rhodobacter sp. 24-YEA-8]
MKFDGDQHTAQAIADEWEIDVDALDRTSWVLEEREGNDGEIYGYLVRFSPDTDNHILKELGLASGDLTREVSASAFETDDFDDREDDDDGIFSLEKPFPDLFAPADDDDSRDIQKKGSETSYLVTEDGAFITDEAGNRIILEGTEADDGLDDPIAAARDELLSRLTGVEDALRQLQKSGAPNLHNNPPEPVDDNPLSREDLEGIRIAIAELRREAQADVPQASVIGEQGKILRNVAYSVTVWIARKLNMGVDTLIKWSIPAGAAAIAHRDPELVARALNAAAEAAENLSRIVGGG